MTRSRVTNLIEEFRQLNEVEQAVFLDQVDPQPEPPEAPAKKTRKPRAARTPRITGLPKPGSDAPKGDADESAGPNCGICGNPEDHSDHDPTYLSSHVFEAPGKSKRSRKLNLKTDANAENVSAVGASAGD